MLKEEGTRMGGRGVGVKEELTHYVELLVFYRWVAEF